MQKIQRFLFRIVILIPVFLLVSGCGSGSSGSSPGLSGAADSSDPNNAGLSYTVVDTGQMTCYDDIYALVSCPVEGALFFGQDGQYEGVQPSYTDNLDGTVTDNNTGLMWQQDPGAKMTYGEAVAGVASFTLAGYDDWRLPTIKELYSLILFSGTDPNAEDRDAAGLTPFIDTDFFVFTYGDTAIERIIDSQYLSSTKYVFTTMHGNPTVFGVNFADGRIKGYPIADPTGWEKTFYVLHVRGSMDYGVNDFIANNDGTVSDTATGLIWLQDDSGSFEAGDTGDGSLDWGQALAWCEDLDFAGYNDWRLPNAKELQSIVDYERSPDTTGSPAIDPLFSSTMIINEKGEADYPYYWTSTSHARADAALPAAGVYLSFGRAMGYMMGEWLDVHGAGAQRSDPKTGNPDAYPQGRGPQGDAIRIYNYARCVR